MHGYATLLDMTDATLFKSLGRPVFGVREDEWPDWSTMSAQLSVLSEDLARVLERVAESPTTVVTIEMLELARPGITASARQAHDQTALTSKRPAVGIVKAVDRNNGVEGLIDKWESASSNLMDESVKIAILMSKAPAAIKGSNQILGFSCWSHDC